MLMRLHHYIVCTLLVLPASAACGAEAAAGSPELDVAPAGPTVEVATDMPDGPASDDADPVGGLAAPEIRYDIGISYGLLTSSEPDLAGGGYAALEGAVWLTDDVGVELSLGYATMKDLYYVGEMRFVPILVSGVVRFETNTPLSLRLAAGAGTILVEHYQTDVDDLRVWAVQFGMELDLPSFGRAFCVAEGIRGGVVTGEDGEWRLDALFSLRGGVEYSF